MISDKRLEKLRRTMNATTRGKWRAFISGDVIEVQSEDGKAVVSWMGFDGLRAGLMQRRRDARFIVVAHEAMPLLLDEIERLQAIVSQMPFSATTGAED